MDTRGDDGSRDLRRSFQSGSMAMAQRVHCANDTCGLPDELDLQCLGCGAGIHTLCAMRGKCETCFGPASSTVATSRPQKSARTTSGTTTTADDNRTKRTFQNRKRKDGGAGASGGKLMTQFYRARSAERFSAARFQSQSSRAVGAPDEGAVGVGEGERQGDGDDAGAGASVLVLVPVQG